MEQVKVVARFLDGTMVKGYTNDFFPKKAFFHVGPDASDRGNRISVSGLKALFFVRDFEGEAGRERKQSFEEGRVYQGRKAEVTFRDGERMAGTILSYDTQRPGFFMIPADGDEGNNTKVFIVSAAVDEVKFL